MYSRHRNLVARIERHLRDNGLTRREFARRCEIKESALAFLMTQAQDTQIGTLEKLASGMNLKPSALLAELEAQRKKPQHQVTL